MIKFILTTAVVACAQYGAQKATNDLIKFVQNEANAAEKRAMEKAARQRELLTRYVRANLDNNMVLIGVEIQRHEGGVMAAIKEANALLSFYNRDNKSGDSCVNTITESIFAAAKITDDFFQLIGGTTGENLTVATATLIDFLADNKDVLEA